MDSSEPPYSVAQHKDLPVIVITLNRVDGTAANTIRAINQAVDLLLTEIDGPAYTIADFRAVSVSFGELVQGMAAAARREPGSLNDPRVSESLLVSQNSLVEFASKAFGQDQYGNLNVPLFPDIEAALAYIESRLSAAESPD